jgi:tRNA (cmo5U34)-methyltransferase
VPREHSQKVARHFAEDWQAYDRQIRQVIPYYDQALTTMVDVIAASCPNPRLILDLGIGTGNLASLVLSTFPAARLVGVDILQDFIDQAERRLTKYADRASLICADVADVDLPSACDIVVSSFMFHHLDNALKRRLFVRIHETLAADGCFINLDFVHSASRFYAPKFDDLRIKYMQAQGVSEVRIATEYVEHRKLEIPVPLGKQLQWLGDAGFTDTECFWKYLNLAMFGGRK